MSGKMAIRSKASENTIQTIASSMRTLAFLIRLVTTQNVSAELMTHRALSVTDMSYSYRNHWKKRMEKQILLMYDNT